ncbi:nitrilase-related carbon-nitrogen hydrolase [Blastomonas fulva]|uniref:nitrilase-related carbon-nitrogen hydrolase n=1 Tax=Blastomonas fulva TaxID=1550728 RepID=UPI003D290A4A
MSRVIRCGVAQMGGIDLAEPRAAVVARMLALLDQAYRQQVQFLVFPELALTTFFPRYWYADLEDADRFFERDMPGPATEPLFAAARRTGIAMSFGYAERSGPRRFNTALLADGQGTIVGRYRKVHLPGHADHRPELPFQHLEQRYFETGDSGFRTWPLLGAQIGLCICNDRRWPETYRMLALRGAEIVALGYNTPIPNTDYDEPAHLNMFHHLLSLQAGAYQNGVWVLAAAKCGREDGHQLMGGSCIVAPTGEIVARTLNDGDALLVHDCDLAMNRLIRDHIFDFSKRRPQFYRDIAQG